jgi:hypothetical protein
LNRYSLMLWFKSRDMTDRDPAGRSYEYSLIVTRNLPIQDELAKLLSQTFKLDDERSGRKAERSRPNPDKKEEREKPTFMPKRYPSVFRIDAKAGNGDAIPMVKVPLGGERTIKFSTDVEDQYFDRVKDPGELQIGLLSMGNNESEGGKKPGTPKNLNAVLNVVKSSPQSGTVRVLMKPTADVKVGDAIELQASLSGPEGDLEQSYRLCGLGKRLELRAPRMILRQHKFFSMQDWWRKRIPVVAVANAARR